MTLLKTIVVFLILSLAFAEECDNQIALIASLSDEPSTTAHINLYSFDGKSLLIGDFDYYDNAVLNNACVGDYGLEITWYPIAEGSELEYWVFINGANGHKYEIGRGTNFFDFSITEDSES